MTKNTEHLISYICVYICFKAIGKKAWQQAYTTEIYHKKFLFFGHKEIFSNYAQSNQ